MSCGDQIPQVEALCGLVLEGVRVRVLLLLFHQRLVSPGVDTTWLLLELHLPQRRKLSNTAGVGLPMVPCTSPASFRVSCSSVNGPQTAFSLTTFSLAFALGAVGCEVVASARPAASGWCRVDPLSFTLRVLSWAFSIPSFSSTLASGGRRVGAFEGSVPWLVTIPALALALPLDGVQGAFVPSLSSSPRRRLNPIALHLAYSTDLHGVGRVRVDKVQHFRLELRVGHGHGLVLDRVPAGFRIQHPNQHAPHHIGIWSPGAQLSADTESRFKVDDESSEFCRRLGPLAVHCNHISECTGLPGGDLWLEVGKQLLPRVKPIPVRRVQNNLPGLRRRPGVGLEHRIEIRGQALAPEAMLCEEVCLAVKPLSVCLADRELLRFLQYFPDPWVVHLGEVQNFVDPPSPLLCLAGKGTGSKVFGVDHSFVPFLTVVHTSKQLQLQALHPRCQLTNGVAVGSEEVLVLSLLLLLLLLDLLLYLGKFFLGLGHNYPQLPLWSQPDPPESRR